MDENQETPESRDESMEVDQTVEKQDSTAENKDGESWKPPTADEIRCVQVLPFFFRLINSLLTVELILVFWDF